MKNKYVRALLCIILTVALLVPQTVTAYATFDEELNKIETIIPSGISPWAVRYSAIIMQGNTNEEDDCNAVYNGLANNGTYRMSQIGWTHNSDGSSTIKPQRVTSTQFRISDGYEFAYYSGHGSKSTGYPVLNATASNSSGTSSPFNVATLLGVDGSDWRTSSLWNTADNLRVLMLASCHQLDSTIMKYYARLMRASKMRAIAGYHSTGPGHDTDVKIANAFFNYAAAGNSVWYSWQHANEDNGNKPWAVLVCKENSNQYYRLPGFPGNTYSDPSATAEIYRYASHLNGSSQVVTTSIGLPSEQSCTMTSDASVSNLPLYISVGENTDVDSAVDRLNIVNRETVECENTNVPINSLPIDNIMQSLLPTDMLRDVVLYQYPVVRCEIDPDTGYVDGSDVVVQRTYKYYNTYNGVRINNAFIQFGVDAEGISYITNRWKDVAVDSERTEILTTSACTIDVNAAFCNISDAGYTEFENADVQLVYEPIGNGQCKLCYEFQSDDAILLVDAETGTVSQ